MLTIYLKAVFATFRQTIGDLWGVLWRPRHALQEIFERGTWCASLILLLVIGYIGMPGMVIGILKLKSFSIIAKFGFSLFRVNYIGYLFLFGFLVTLLIGIKSYAKTGQWYSFLRIAGYCMLPAILLIVLPSIIIFLLGKINILHSFEFYFSQPSLGIISLVSICFFLFFFLTFRLLSIMLNIVCPAMRHWQRLVTVLAAFLGGDIMASVCLSVYNMINTWWKG